MPRASSLKPSEPSREEGLIPFLTAYDPADLPGSSVDPLGFDRAVNFLSDKILPGLTNAGRMPRYFSLLCAGVVLGDGGDALPERLARQQRLEALLRLERLWVLANLLASDVNPELPARMGIRGALYGRAHLEHLERNALKRTGTDFKLLIRQVPYGVVGIYGNVATGMKLLDNKSFTPFADSGDKLGHAFLDETETPASVRKAVQDPRADVSLPTLAEWGQRAHLSAGTGALESEVLESALHHDPTRSRMARLLADHPTDDANETELARMRRIAIASSQPDEIRDLCEALTVIPPFELCYRQAVLILERVLWLAGQNDSQSISATSLRTDPVIERTASTIAAETEALEAAISAATTVPFLENLHRMDESRQFLRQMAGASEDPLELARTVIDRHAVVQRGKRDRGRAKQPWIELRGDTFELTLSRAGELNREPKAATDIKAHEYRTASADALLIAALRGEQ